MLSTLLSSVSHRAKLLPRPPAAPFLEVAWEALEDAGYPLKKVAGTRTGVFTGASSHDYYDIQDVDSLTTHSVTGWAMCMTSNRISYAFDLHGPEHDFGYRLFLFARRFARRRHQPPKRRVRFGTGVRRERTLASYPSSRLQSAVHAEPHQSLSRFRSVAETDMFGVREPGWWCSNLWTKALADGDHIYATILAHRGEF